MTVNDLFTTDASILDDKEARHKQKKRDFIIETGLLVVAVLLVFLVEKLGIAPECGGSAILLTAGALVAMCMIYGWMTLVRDRRR